MDQCRKCFLDVYEIGTVTIRIGMLFAVATVPLHRGEQSLASL